MKHTYSYNLIQYKGITIYIIQADFTKLIFKEYVRTFDLCNIPFFPQCYVDIICLCFHLIIILQKFRLIFTKIDP